MGCRKKDCCEADPLYPYLIHERNGAWYNLSNHGKIMAKNAQEAALIFAEARGMCHAIDILVESVTCEALQPFHIEPIIQPRYTVTPS